MHDRRAIDVVRYLIAEVDMIRNRWGIVPVVALLLLPSVASAQQDLSSLHRAAAAAGGRVIVMLKTGGRGAMLRAPGAPQVTPGQMETIETRLTRVHHVRVRSRAPFMGALITVVADSDLDRLVADSNVAAVEADVASPVTSIVSHVTRAPTAGPSDDIKAGSEVIPWGVTDVGAPQAWAAGLTGAGVKVGMIDGGIDITHPDLHVVGGQSFQLENNVASNYNDDVASCDGHGTHTAGTVAALQNGQGVVGVAPGVSLYALKVLEDDGSGCIAWLSSQINALQWAVTNHLDVVSISIGNSASSTYDYAVAAAVAAGVNVVAASGNNNGGAIVTPAASPGAIAVAALNAGNTVASYSNAGPQMWVAAPGTNIESTLPGGNYGTMSGTSMATPHVTGVVALLKQAHPTWTPAQIRAQLESSATDLSTPGFDNATGWGLVQAPGGTPTPVALAVSPRSRKATVQQGSSAPSDQATVTLSGTNASSTPWTATKKKSWTTLTTASGTGSGTVAWSRNSTALTAGTYVDTITVSATGATGSPTVVYDSLVVTPVIIPVTLAVAPGARSVSVQQGGAAAGSSATVTLTGTDAATTAWTASKKKSWTTLTTASGTGSGTVAWTRSTVPLAVGMYVDTITVTAAGAIGSPTVVYDTIHVTAAPVPVTIAVSPAARSATIQAGSSAPNTSVAVTLAGDNAATTAWSATHKASWTSITTGSGTGSGTLAWTRNTTALGVGTYVDTFTVSATGAVNSPVKVYDTLHVTAAPVPVTIAVSPAARSATIQAGSSAPNTSVTVTLTGDNAATTTWSTTHKASWTSITNGSATGSGTLAWNRATTALGVGTYVDTFTVSATGAVNSPVKVYDTLHVTAAPVPVTIAVSPAARSATIQAGNSAPNTSVAVTLTGDNAGTTNWSATDNASWTSITTGSGTGSGTLAWNRTTTALGVGTYVDTITVSASGAVNSPVKVYDTLHVTAAPVPVTIAVSPSARSATIQAGGSAPNTSVAVTLSGNDAGTTNWSATHKASWTSITTGSGTGSGTLAWSRSTSTLAVGTYVDTFTVSASGAVNSPVLVFDTLHVTAVPVPVTISVNPIARNATIQVGNSAPNTSVAVTLSGDNAATTTWSTTHKASWTSITSGSGTGSGTLAWSRSTSTLAVGMYVDTFTVSASGAVNSPVLVFDTLGVTAAPVPITIAVTPISHGAVVVQGTAAPTGSASVVLSGTNANSVSWTTTHRGSWLSLMAAAGTGSGAVTWQRSTLGLGVGVHVDTIEVIADGAVGSPAMVIDSLQIVSAPLPLTIAFTPRSRSASVMQGNVATDQATVALAGPGADVADWTAGSSASWLSLDNASGNGSQLLSWSYRTAQLVPGLHVDTITVTSGSARAVLLDSVTVTPVVRSIALTPRGRSLRSVRFANSGARLSVIPVDSAVVEGIGLDSTIDGTWIATVSSDRLQLQTTNGSVGSHVVWGRPPQDLANGLYVDTVTVTVTNDASLQAQFVDSLEVATVTAPEPDAAVTDLFTAASLTDDQRSAMDAQGNSNGRYDLGDFLAWVSQNHIQLSSAVAMKLRTAMSAAERPVARPAQGPQTAKPPQ
jgi:minor extracellular protease Epr